MKVNSLAQYNTPEQISAVFLSHGIGYVWLPVEDMSTSNRMLAIPHSATILEKLIASGHVVYVHW